MHYVTQGQQLQEQKVDPWNVQGGEDGRIDYNKLVEQVGVKEASSPCPL